VVNVVRIFARACALTVVCATLAVAFAPRCAHAQYHPVIALSGRAGVPVVINGYDATGAIVEGDWGLARPGATVTVIDPGPFLIPLPPRGAYFPATGRRPGYGRREIDFPRRAGPAESYHRSWSAGSDDAPLAAAPTFAARDYEYPPQRSKRRAKHRARGRR
jgi:hypothetical protein